MITKMFGRQLGGNMEAYIDDMVVKNRGEESHIHDLDEVFNILRVHKLKQNADKCAFGVGSGRFIGYLVTQRGIEADPKQIAALQSLVAPRTLKEIQKLTGMAAALNRFISRSTDKCRPFFELLKKCSRRSFHWSEECEEAFQQLKTYL